MIIKRQIGERGQVVIPLDIRRALGLKKGSTLTFEVSDDGIRMKNENTEGILQEFFTNARTKGKDLTLAELKKIEAEGYDLP